MGPDLEAPNKSQHSERRPVKQSDFGRGRRERARTLFGEEDDSAVLEGEEDEKESSVPLSVLHYFNRSQAF
jgi:hypothetical protein